jgi:hypothetical protein
VICDRCDHHFVEHRADGCSHVDKLDVDGDGDDFLTVAETKLYCNCTGYKKERP